MPANPAKKPTKPATSAVQKSARKSATGDAQKHDVQSANHPDRTTKRPAAAAPRKKGRPEAPPPFTGFPKDFLAFFRELAKHNDREWFAANKQRYLDSIQAPLRSFVAAMDLPLGRMADCFVADSRSIFRIYNDMRFHDAKPYKEHAACQFRHEAGKDAHAPGFYVHFEPKEVFFGGGIWRPPGPQLRQVRAAIAADPERWTKITRSPAFRRRFGGVEGDSLKRPPQGFDADHPAIEDLKRTSFFAVQTVKPDAIQSKEFVREVAKAFEALAPFMEFLTEAVELKFHHG